MNKKENIIKAAQNLFAHFGLSKTTIGDIAREARMGKASIYYYFESKESIFHEVIDKEAMVLKKEILDAVNNKSLPQEKIRAYVLARAYSLKKLANYYNAFHDDYLRSYYFIENARDAYNQFEKNLIQSILQDGVQQRIFEIEDVDLTTEAILAAIKGLEYQWTVEVTMERIKQNLDTLLKILFKGIEKKD